MSATTPTTPSLLSPDPVPAVVLATATLGTPYTLDLRTKWGAWLMGRIANTGIDGGSPITFGNTDNIVSAGVVSQQAASALTGRKTLPGNL